MERILKNTINNFNRTKDSLICVDSDGCAINTMTIKHQKCFAPSFAEIFCASLDPEIIIDRWLQINLFSKYRGINRFKGSAMLLKELKPQLENIEGLDEYIQWTDTTPTYSNAELEKYYLNSKNDFARKILNWSYNVNEKILALDISSKLPFSEVKETLKFAFQFADIAVVSSANSSAVLSEWKNAQLISYTSAVLTQENGSKSACINSLLKFGYKKNRTLMIGDAPSDLQSAKACDILFFPVIPKNENESWKELRNKIIPMMLKDEYTLEIQKEMIQKMENTLK